MEAYGLEFDDFEGDDCCSLAVRDWADYCVYVLLCPVTKRIRYVGSTRQIRNRKSAHTKQVFSNPKSPVQEWTTAMINRGTPALMRVIVHVRAVGFGVNGTCSVTRTDVEMRHIEKRIIRKCLANGCDLLNVAHTSIER